jgi:hypothetical protein
MVLKDFDFKALALVGIVCGLTQVLAGVVMYLGGIYFASWSFLVSLVVLLLCIVVGTLWYRLRHLKPGITYGQTLIVGIVISVSTGIIYAVYNIISISFFYPNFLNDFIRISAGSTVAQTPEVAASRRESITATSIALGNLIRLSVAGSFLSIFTSLFLRKR